MSSIKFTREVVILPRTETTLLCPVTSRSFCFLRLIEKRSESLHMATSLNRPQKNGQIVARCIISTKQPLTLRAGSTIGTFTAAEAEQVQYHKLKEVNTLSRIQGSYPHQGPIPEHVGPLFNAAKENCHSLQETRRLGGLLIQCSSVFSTGDRDIGRTTLVEHSIPLIGGAKQIR